MSAKIWLLLGFLCLFSCSFVAAAPDVVFDRVVNDLSTITLNDTIYTVRVGTANNSQVKLIAGEYFLFLDEGECIKKRYDEFCYEEWDDPGRAAANFTDYRPIIEVDREVEERKVPLGGTSDISVSFENTGGTDVTNFFFSEKIPDIVEVVNVSGCSENNNLITADRNIDVDETITCNYTLRGVKTGTTSFFGTISSTQVKSSDIDAVPQVNFEVEQDFIYNITLSKTNLEAFQPFTVDISVQNIESETSDTNLSFFPISVHLSDDIKFSKKYDGDMVVLPRQSNVNMSVTIEPQESASQRIELIPETLENATLTVEFNYQFIEDGETPTLESFEVDIPLDIRFIELSCEYVVVDEAGNNLISLFELNNSLPGLDSGELFLRLVNKNNYLDFKDLSYSTSGDFDFPNTGDAKSIRRSGYEDFAKVDFFFSDIDRRNYTTKARVRYSPMEGVLLNEECTQDIHVPYPETLEVEKELIFVRQNVSGVEKIVPRILITVTNNFFTGIRDIEFKETFPEYFFTNLDFPDTLDIARDRQQEISYDLIIPNEYIPLENEVVPITSEFIITYLGVEVSVNKTLEVDLLDLASKQQNISLESVIEDKVLTLRPVQNITIVINKTNTTEVISTYSPVLPYFSIAMLVILLFFVIIVARHGYGSFITIMKNRRHRKKIEKKMHDLDDSKKFIESVDKSAIKNLHSLDKKIMVQEKELKNLSTALQKLQRNAQKNKVSLSKEMSKKHEKLVALSSKKLDLEKQIATLSNDIEAAKQIIINTDKEVEQSGVLLNQKQGEVNQLKAQKEKESGRHDRLQQKIKMLEEQIANDKKNEEKLTELKRKELEQKIRELDENRKLLKEQQRLLSPVEE